jgi:meiotically up-regulated gene 157 (Mug157) protein
VFNYDFQATDAGTSYMHERFHADDPSQYTRPWFAWANSLFGEFMSRLLGENKLKTCTGLGYETKGGGEV